MNNYAAELRKFTASLEYKPSLLLHCCCAPCASACFEELKGKFEITAYYFNPNITDADEYAKRFAELKKLCAVYGAPAVDAGFSPSLFFNAVKGLESCPERGDRCKVCIARRLRATAEEAKKYDYFATTLTLSPLKDAEYVNNAGLKAAEETGSRYLPSDFKKFDGYKKSIELSEKYGLYRQNFCGCEFSRR